VSGKKGHVPFPKDDRRAVDVSGGRKRNGKVVMSRKCTSVIFISAG
jgi:hypothetical protein